MKFRHLLNLSAIGALLITATGCRQNKDKNAQQALGNAGKVSHLITEDFEQSDKAHSKAYTTAILTFKSGEWLLDDALIGSAVNDAKNGAHAIRIRNNGKLSMQFDVQNCTNISVSYAVYGNDKSSAWQLFASYDGGSTYQQIGDDMVASGHTLQKFSMPLITNGNIRFEIRKSGGKSRLDIDDIVITEQFNSPPVDTNDHISLNTTDSVPGDNGNMLLGNPSAAITNSSTSADNYLIDHYYYTESYNRTKAEPNWVSWHIAATDITGKRGPDDFRADTDLPKNWFAADNTSYSNSGFDKGHNCPSGDRSSNPVANSATFLMDNIIPQAPNNNQHTWEHLEAYCRLQVRNGNEVYVIMGSYGTGGTGRHGYATTISKGKINVPAHIWKVAVIIPNGNNDLKRVDAAAKIIAIDTPNDNSVAPNWMLYLCTVRDIESATGYDLLSALPKNVQDALEEKKFEGDRNIME